MAANDAVLLRSLELRILRCSIPSDNPSSPPPSPTQPSPLYSLLNDVVTLIESGHYLQALSSSKVLFPDLQFETSDSAELFYSETLPNCVSSFLNVNSCDQNYVELGYRALLLMAVGVAALLAFTQCNITGPLDKLPCMPLANLLIRKDGVGGGEWMEWEAWTHKELMSVGSELRGKFSNLQYIIFAKTLLLKTRDFLFEGKCSSIDALFLQQRLLDERSSFLFDLLQVFKRESLFYLGSLEKIKDYWGANEDCSNFLSTFHLEVGIQELYYGFVDASR
ncbi:hypothetical protein ACJIZ3_018016 [Penstemon smallii]|uniref:Uncharacterized protein n=1 Tax=Penstemon smallii TaxID=265156 RepID=A0ABD3SX75_9LAMI